MAFEIKRWSEIAVVAEPPRKRPEGARRCGCYVWAYAIEGAEPVREWCAACALAERLKAFEGL